MVIRKYILAVISVDMTDMESVYAALPYQILFPLLK